MLHEVITPCTSTLILVITTVESQGLNPQVRVIISGQATIDPSCSGVPECLLLSIYSSSIPFLSSIYLYPFYPSLTSPKFMHPSYQFSSVPVLNHSSQREMYYGECVEYTYIFVSTKNWFLHWCIIYLSTYPLHPLMYHSHPLLTVFPFFSHIPTHDGTLSGLFWIAPCRVPKWVQHFTVEKLLKKHEVCISTRLYCLYRFMNEGWRKKAARFQDTSELSARVDNGLKRLVRCWLRE